MRDIFYLFISNHMNLYQRKNSKITKIRSTLVDKEGQLSPADLIFFFIHYHLCLARLIIQDTPLTDKSFYI